MVHRFLIRWSAPGDTDWVALGRDAAVLQGPSRGLPQGQAGEVLLLLPAQDVLLLDVPRMAKRSAQIAQALPFAIEEQLAAPIEQQHVAFAERPDGQPLAVAVVARERLRAALDELAAAGIAVDRAYSEAQMLPWQANHTSRFDDGKRSLLRWGESAALTLETQELAALDPWLDAQGLPPRQTVGAEVPALRLFAAQLQVLRGPDLLQGEFRPRERVRASRGAWRLAAVLAAAALLLSFTQLLLERRGYQQHVQARGQEMEQILRHALPATQRVVDPLAQLKAALGQGGPRQGDALALLARIAPALSGSGRFSVDALEYNAGTLELTLTAPDVATLDGLREQLAAMPPLQVELTAATPGSRGVEGRLRIREGGA